MAAIIREALNADGMGLVLFTGGMSKIGFNLSGTWVGTVSFFYSTDGVNFAQFPLSVTPFASGTTVQTATGNGNWECNCQNFLAVKVVFARTSGTVIATIAASVDASYQDAFLSATSICVSQSVSGGTVNTVTVAAQANRAWRVDKLVIGFSTAPGNPVLVTISDGASSVLWETYVPIGATGVIGTFDVPLPPPDPTNGMSGGVVNTPGNSMVITLAAPGGSVVSKVNARMQAA